VDLDISLLRDALDALPEADGEARLQGHSQSLLVELETGASTAPRPQRNEWASIHRLTWTITAITERLLWQHDKARSGELPTITWQLFAGADIYLFHVVLRQIYDHLGRSIAALARRPAQVRGRTFRQLVQWAREPAGRERLGSDWADLLATCLWFDSFRAIRDAIVHGGAEPLALEPGEHIRFVIVIDRRPLTLDPFFVVAGVDEIAFERYAAVYYGYTLGFVERVARRIRELRGTLGNPRAFSRTGGGWHLRRWIEALPGVAVR
jgi:hypothetical protein